MNLFLNALNGKNTERPPVWFMRQAGRYHSHYQKLKQQHSFIELCKNPELACEVTMGPINEFGFDAAILFSDLLFPLEAMGMGLDYSPGPVLSWHLREKSDLVRLNGDPARVSQLGFQAAAIQKIRKKLSSQKGLIGFVGAPFTLYCYAVEGSHQGNLDDARFGLLDGRYHGFCETLLPLLKENILSQASAGPDAIALFDTCAGELSPDEYREFVVPVLDSLLRRLKSERPELKIIYYSKGTDRKYFDHLRQLNISCLGFDWNLNLAQMLSDYSDRWALQGNLNPNWLLEEKTVLLKNAQEVFDEVKKLPKEKLRGWVCGLGHGVLQKTPEENVHALLELQQKVFA